MRLGNRSTKTSKESKTQKYVLIVKKNNFKMNKTNRNQIGFLRRLIYTSEEAIEVCHNTLYVKRPQTEQKKNRKIN